MPTAVAELTGAKMIGAGNDHNCAAVADGLVCWGGNYAGELGNGQKATTSRRRSPSRSRTSAPT